MASLPRGACQQHGVLTAHVFWAEQNSRFTALFERFAIEVLRATQVQAKAAQILSLSADQGHSLLPKAVARGLRQRDPNQANVPAGREEKRFQPGRRYATIGSDLARARVLDVSRTGPRRRARPYRTRRSRTTRRPACRR